MEPVLPRVFLTSAYIDIYTGHQGGLVLWYCTRGPTRRTIWDAAGYKGFHMPLKACAYGKNGMMLLPRGIARCSVRPWRVWN